jgi:ABC-2 type transport system ATP-binding protein
MLEVRDLRKRFGAVQAVQGVSFRIDPGECFGLLGPNGAGKTTTISMIVGALAPDSGDVLLDGKLVRGDLDPRKRLIGFVPQELALYDDLSAATNLAFFGALYGLEGAALRARIEAVLRIVGLAERQRAPVRTFSGGMRRRLNLAAGLLHEPRLLILDEPTVGVDPQSRNAIFESLRALTGAGVTMLYTTHYMEEVERLCGRVAIMDGGAVVALDTLAGLHRLVPRTNRLLIELAEQDHTSPPGWLDAVRSLPGVSAASCEGQRLTVDVSHLTDSAAAVLGWLAAHGRDVVSVTTERPDLEQVFLHLTGRALRD